MVPANLKVPVTMNEIKNVSIEPVMRQLIAFKKLRRCCSSYSCLIEAVTSELVSTVIHSAVPVRVGHPEHEPRKLVLDGWRQNDDLHSVRITLLYSLSNGLLCRNSAQFYN